jgi:hypothetical protein
MAAMILDWKKKLPQEQQDKIENSIAYHMKVDLEHSRGKTKNKISA